MSELAKKNFSWITMVIITIATIVNVVIVTPLVKDRQYESKQIGALRENVSTLAEIVHVIEEDLDSKADKEKTELRINLCKEEVVNIVRAEIKAGNENLKESLKDAGILIYGSNK